VEVNVTIAKSPFSYLPCEKLSNALDNILLLLHPDSPEFSHSAPNLSANNLVKESE